MSYFVFKKKKYFVYILNCEIKVLMAAASKNESTAASFGVSVIDMCYQFKNSQLHCYVVEFRYLGNFKSWLSWD